MFFESKDYYILNNTTFVVLEMGVGRSENRIHVLHPSVLPSSVHRVNGRRGVKGGQCVED